MINSIQDICNLAVAGESDWSQYGHVYTKEQGDLILFNYTPQAHFTNKWNFFERVSRGLIIDRVTGGVVARPYDKFFNWGEKGRYGKGHIVTVTEKMDGSLGILYRHNGEYKIATRGSFDSEQAVRATDFLNTLWGPQWVFPEELTLLFEIIAPWNRVVVDYGDYANLCLIAARNRYTGEYLPYSSSTMSLYHLAFDYGFDLVKQVNFHSITDIIEATGKIDANQEGWVVEMSDGSRWKFKGDDYKHLHRLITGLSYKRAVEAVKYDKVNALLEIIPDEFLDEFKKWVEEIRNVVYYTNIYIDTAFHVAPKSSRKEFAQWVNEYQPWHAPYLFKKYDGKDYQDLMFQREFK
ncbi:MAG: RNA ligase [Planctomycetota bacterium]